MLVFSCFIGLFTDFAYGIGYGKKDIGPSLEHLARRPRTWAEFVREQDWDAILG